MSGGLSASDVNSNIPLEAGQGVPQFNPLQQIGQFADTANALNQLKLFPGQQQLQQQAITSGGLQIQGERTDLAQKNNEAVNGFLTPLLALPSGEITHADLTTQLGAAEASGYVTQPAIAALLQAGPSGDGPAFDAYVRAHIASQAQNNPAQAVAEVTPSQGTIDTGAAIQPVNIAPAGSEDVGQVSPVGGAFDKTISPETMNTPMTWKNSNGDTIQGTYSQYLQAVQGGTVQFGSQIPAPGATTPQSSSTAAPSQKAPPEWNGFAFPSTALNPSTNIAAGVPDQQANSTDMYKGDVNSVQNASKTLTNLQNIVAEGQNAGTGALSDTLMKLGSTAQQLGLADGQQATDLQLIGKNVSQAVQSSLGTLGIPTDSKMNEIIEGTPNASMTPDAIKTAAAQIMGGIQWKQSELAAFAQYQQAAEQQGLSVGPGAYAQFNEQWQQKVPVATFQLSGMPATQRAQYLKSLSPAQQYQIYLAQKQMSNLGLAPQ